MRRLILMRHAKSDWNHPGLSDHERPLNARGRRSADALGGWLRDKGYLPDEVLCSSAQRTRETLQNLKLPAETPTEFLRSLYHADPGAMLRALAGAEGQCVLMIGHNPGICAMAHALLPDAPDHPRFEDYPTGATLVCDFETTDWGDVDWGDARLAAFVIPRDLI